MTKQTNLSIGLTALICIAGMLCPSICKAIQRSNAAMIRGHVYYKDGTPVSGAEVEVHTFGPFEGVIPQPVRTDASGRFTIIYPPLGEGYISASKVDEGYPNVALALYGRENFTSIQSIDLQAGTNVENIDLKFGDPDAVIDFHVIDKNNGRNITNARITIQWSRDPNIMSSLTIPESGIFTFVAPKHPVEIVVSASGYTGWYWVCDQTNQTIAAIVPGKHFRVSVPLLPSH